MDCPDCGSTKITSEVGPEQATGTNLETAIFSADEGSSVQVVHQCWNCGWEETRTVTVDEVTVKHGDKEVIEHSRLVSQLIAAAQSIEDTDKLERLLDDAQTEAES